MSGRDVIGNELTIALENQSPDLLRRLAETSSEKVVNVSSSNSVVIGDLIGMADVECAPLVRYAGQPGYAALPARTVVDLDGSFIGRQVVLAFERGDPAKPIIMGVLRESRDRPKDKLPNPVEVDADGERLMVSAKEQIVFRCGEASITLTKAGKVLIRGTYVVSRSTGVHRIKGGSVQIN